MPELARSRPPTGRYAPITPSACLPHSSRGRTSSRRRAWSAGIIGLSRATAASRGTRSALGSPGDLAQSLRLHFRIAGYPSPSLGESLSSGFLSSRRSLCIQLGIFPDFLCVSGWLLVAPAGSTARLAQRAVPPRRCRLFITVFFSSSFFFFFFLTLAGIPSGNNIYSWRTTPGRRSPANACRSGIQLRPRLRQKQTALPPHFLCIQPAAGED